MIKNGLVNKMKYFMFVAYLWTKPSIFTDSFQLVIIYFACSW